MRALALVLIVAGCDSAYAPRPGEAEDQAARKAAAQAAFDTHSVVGGGDPIPYSASYMVETYESNEAEADGLFKDKPVRVSGKIASIGVDIMGHAFVSLNDTLGGVQCTLRSKGMAMGLRKRQNVACIGVCKGFVIGTVSVTDAVVEK